MGNNYFAFKKFTVYQDSCAMKVSTDACLLGALVNINPAPTRILDIGTGTGILSLMMAQHFNQAAITALEINADAFQQAKSNFAKSHFASQIEALHIDVTSFKGEPNFDFIISNPPYFQQSLHTTNYAINTAKHATQLTFAQLAQSVARLLAPNGTFSFILPYASVHLLQQCLHDNALCLTSQINIRHNANKPFLNAIVNGAFGDTLSVTIRAFTIRDLDNTYTQEALDILTPFYLGL